MGLKSYEVVVPGRRGGTTATLLLSDEDAKRAGVFEEPQAAPAKPRRQRATGARKARAPRNKSTKADENKAATPQDDKSADPAGKAPIEDASDPDASE